MQAVTTRLATTPRNGKFPRITVILTFLLENWSPGIAPPYSPMTSPPKPGQPDRAGILWSEYAGRSGIARLLRISQRHGASGTVCVNARSAELFPDTVRHIVDAGFEVAAHNYAQDQVLAGLSEAEERATIQRCLAILETIAGRRPCGWISSTLANTERTIDLLAQEGLIWHGDCNNRDQPHMMSTAYGDMVAIPHSDYADNRVLRGAPRDWYDVHQDLFDYLYRQEPGSMLNVTMHGNFGGRTLMAAQLDRLLSYIGQYDDVWMPRHDELARWVREHDIREIPYTERFGF